MTHTKTIPPIEEIVRISRDIHPLNLIIRQYDALIRERDGMDGQPNNMLKQNIDRIESFLRLTYTYCPSLYEAKE